MNIVKINTGKFKHKFTRVVKINRSAISYVDGKLVLKCDKKLAVDMKDIYDLDVQSQKLLRHIYFNTVDGKFSVTIPNHKLQYS